MNEKVSIWLTRTQLAERLAIPPKTLAEWASKGIGPRYAKFGRHVRYLLRDVLEWESGRLVDPDDRVA
ncbi:MAG: helix-turn-helix transcriptional regulator [Mycobacterium sp.]